MNVNFCNKFGVYCCCADKNRNCTQSISNPSETDRPTAIPCISTIKTLDTKLTFTLTFTKEQWEEILEDITYSGPSDNGKILYDTIKTELNKEEIRELKKRI